MLQKDYMSCMPALAREGWKRFVYALQGMYNKGGAVAIDRSLKRYDDGNSLTNLDWMFVTFVE